MNQKRIVIDGMTYNSVDEMPEEIRQKYLAAMRNLDKNNDGTPDMLENMDALFGDKDKDGMPDSLAGLVANVVKATRIVADGKEYNSLEELPPEVRAKLSQAMGKFDANQNGIPDFMEGDMVQNVVAAYTSSIHVNGRNYGNVTELPDDMRARVQGAFEKMAELGIVTKTTSPMMMQANSMSIEQKPLVISKPFIPQQVNPAIQEGSGSNTFVLVLGGVVLFLCLIIAAFVVFYFMK